MSRGLTFLCSAGDFDALITGDMAGSTERKLVEQYDLPDIEVLVVGHHGSRYSSTADFCSRCGRKRLSSAWETTATATPPRRLWTGCPGTGPRCIAPTGRETSW